MSRRPRFRPSRGLNASGTVAAAAAAVAAAAAAELDFVVVRMTEGKKHEVRHILRSG